MKRIDLATTENVTTTYAGQDAGRYVRAAILANESLNNGSISVLPNVKYQANLTKIELDDIISNDSCDFVDSGTITYTNPVLTLERFKVNLKVCKDNYRNTWEAEQMGFSAHDELSSNFADFIIDSVAAKVGQKNETNIWQGVNANSGEFDGFEVLMTNQASQPTGYEVAGTTVDASNVVAEIQKVVDAASAALYGSDGFAVRIGSNIARHYIAAQAALGYRDLYHAGVTELSFQGVPLIVCPGMSDDKMIATYNDNLWFGTNVLSDWNEVRLLDQALVDGSDNVHVVMKFAAGIQIASPEDVVTYGITNSGN